MTEAAGVNGLNHLSAAVVNLDATVAFYRDLLGFAVAGLMAPILEPAGCGSV